MNLVCKILIVLLAVGITAIMALALEDERHEEEKWHEHIPSGKRW